MTNEQSTKDKQNKTHRVPHARVTPAEYATIERRAKECGLSLSDFVRRSCLQTRITVSRRPAPTDPALLRQLIGIGTNLNQLAKHANTHGNINHIEELRRCIALIEPILARLVPE